MPMPFNPGLGQGHIPEKDTQTLDCDVTLGGAIFSFNSPGSYGIMRALR
jgi:hypothetical protein